MADKSAPSVQPLSVTSAAPLRPTITDFKASASICCEHPTTEASSSPAGRSIPVIISKRTPSTRKYSPIPIDIPNCGVTQRSHHLRSSPQVADRHMVYPKRHPLLKERRPRSKRPFTAPSLFMANLRSISGKVDEVGFRLQQHRPKLAVFTETWLDADTPDEAVSFLGYSTVRKDRNCRGGGIVC